jgi:hypothetical protein
MNGVEYMNTWELIFLILVGGGIIFDYISRVNKRLRRIEYKVEQLLNI